MTGLRLGVVGGGWAGLAAAVHGVLQGHRVTLFELSHRLGGRARSGADDRLDNGQHILIGAYRGTLELMRTVGVDPRQALLRMPLVLGMADGRTLRLGAGPAHLAFALAVARCTAWSPAERRAVLGQGMRWMAAGFRCEPDRSVEQLCRALPPAVRSLLIDPLCVAALNTPAHEASAAVFLRVLRDGLLGAPGCSDLLLPRVPLHQLLPAPAARWLAVQGATVRSGHRVQQLAPSSAGWNVDDQPFDRVILACGALQSAHLTRRWAPQWSAVAEALRFEPIVTVYVQHDGLTLPLPMLGLTEDARSPAQFVFDRGCLDGRPGLLAFVVSGAAAWVDQGRPACANAVLAQAGQQLGRHGWRGDKAHIVEVVAERRATFRSTPGLRRPSAAVAPGLWAAGDHVEGPYPATLEGAVRAGQLAASLAGGEVRGLSTMQNTVSPY